MIERTLMQAGIKSIAGVDEAGRGPCAGPLVVAMDDTTLKNMLEAVYEADSDNRAYYRALDEVIDANWRATYRTHGKYANDV